MHFAGRDADFSAHAELAAVGKLGRGVPHHDGAVDLVQKVGRRLFVVGDDGVGVVRAVLGDMLHRVVDPGDHFHGHDGVEIFGVPVFVVGRDHPGVER